MQPSGGWFSCDDGHQLQCLPVGLVPGIGGILAKFIGRMNDPGIGQYEGYSLPEPVATWYGSFYTDYMTYLEIAGRDSVLAAQVASPGTQVTIQFIAIALEQAEDQARAKEQTLHEYLENRTIAYIVEQFTQDENCAWLMFEPDNMIVKVATPDMAWNPLFVPSEVPTVPPPMPPVNMFDPWLVPKSKNFPKNLSRMT